MDEKARLSNLEKQVKRLRIALAAVGAGLLVLVLSGMGDPLPDVLRARKVEVVNAQGRVVVTLRADGADGGWIMVASSGDRRKVILDSSPSIVLTDRVGTESVRLSTDMAGHASLQMATVIE